MDLRNIINEAHGQRRPHPHAQAPVHAPVHAHSHNQPPAPPRLHTASSHTPQSSYDARIEHTPLSDVSSARTTPYGPPPPHSVHPGQGDPRLGSQSSHGGPGQAHASQPPTPGGGYFNLTTPYPPNQSASVSTSASANGSISAGAGPNSAHSAYAQSPSQSSHGLSSQTPRAEHANGGSVGSYHGQQANTPFIPPSPSHQQQPPATPGSSHHHVSQNHGPVTNHAGSNYHQAYHHQFQSPPPPQPNGLAPSQARQISPSTQHQGQPVTPLGPPIGYPPRASPQTNRPPSQGHSGYPENHLRRASQSSVGSQSSRDPGRNEYHHPQKPQPPQPVQYQQTSQQYPPHAHQPSQQQQYQQHPQQPQPLHQQANQQPYPPQQPDHYQQQQQQPPPPPPPQYPQTNAPTAPPTGRRESTTELSYYQERERSESVSPKTIPRPVPHRSQSSSSQTYTQAQSQNASVSSHSGHQVSQQSQQQSGSTPPAQSRSQTHLQPQSQLHSSPYHPDQNTQQQRPPPTSRMLSHPSSVGSQHPGEPSPVMSSKIQPSAGIKSERDPSSTPSNRPSIPPESAMLIDSPREKTPIKTEGGSSTLKRRASHLSETRAPPPPQKRARHDVPVWARSARLTMHGQQRPLNFVQPRPRAARNPRHDNRQQQHRNPQQQQQHHHHHHHQHLHHQQQQHSSSRQSHGPLNGSAPPPRQGPLPQNEPGYEPSIAGIQPYEDLTRKICHWIMKLMVEYPPPPSAHYEIEAKIGRVFDRNTDDRLHIPWVDSEVLLDTSKIGTRFKSNMTRYHHQALNEYLNSLVQEKQQRRQHDPSVQQIGYSHPKENDEFFMLTEDGRQNLPPELHQWLNEHPDNEFRERFRRRNEFKVRRTVSKTSGQPTAQIIKIRIGDKDVYNPESDFDYRISISLEMPWDGRQEHLERVANTRGRNKDRMSYRHQMYQVDLTQVSHADDPDQLEHELEIEIGDFTVQQDLQDLMSGGGSDFQTHIKGLIDNARLLCRKGSNVRMDPKTKQQEGW